MRWNSIFKFFGSGKPKWQRFETESGAPLWFLHMPHVRNTSFGNLTLAGSRDEIYPSGISESPDEAGLAHALEHMYFQGSTRCFKNSKEIAIHTEEVGGIDNAYTSEEETFYFHKITSGELERSIKILGESLLYPLFPEEVIPTQMTVVLHELLGRADDPDSFFNELWIRTRMAGHPLSQNPIGLKESIKKFKREDFLKFARKHYNRGNFVYIAVGSIEVERLLGFVNIYFPKPESQESKNNRAIVPVPAMPNGRLILQKDVNETRVLSGAVFAKPDIRHVRALKLFSHMIGGGASFPLFQEVREEKGYCYGIGARVNDYSDAIIFDVFFATSSEDYEKALDLTFKIMKREKSNSELLARAKKLVRGRADLDDGTMGFLFGAAKRISLYGEPMDHEKTIELYDSVTINDVTEAVESYLGEDKFYTGILLPK